MFFNTHLSLIARLFRLRHVRPQTLPLALALAGLTSNPAVFAAASRLPGGESQSSNGRILVVDQNSAGAADTNSGSADAPLLTIGKAVEAAGPGTTVVVKGGTYREQVNVDKSGTADSRISIRAAAGERVVISGADRITGWRRCSQEELRGNTNFSSIYCAELDWSPVRLFCEGNPDNLQPARWPRGDRYRPENYSFLVESGNELRMVDSRQLTQPKGFWEGATLGFYRVANDGVMAGRIVAYDPQKHELIVDKPRRYPPNLGTDRYYIENAPGVIGAPGDYCIDTTREPYRIYLWPLRPGNPNDQNIEGSRRRSAFSVTDASYITIEGFEATRTYGTGIAVGSGTSNEVTRCVVYYCQHVPRTEAAFGIALGAQTGSRVQNCISVLNGYGINIAGSTNCQIEENLVGANIVDAIVACWHSQSVQFRRNCVFNNWFRGHPDGFQTYRDVQRLELDSNLFINVGQGWQCAETQDSLVTNNIWAGIHYGNSISCSLRPAVVGDRNLRNTFVNNTFFGGNVSSGGDSRFVNNIAVPPSFGGTSGGPPIESDYNLVWSDGEFVFRWQESSQKRLQRGNFAQWQRGSRSNPHSLYSNPVFRNAPAFERHLETVTNTEPSQLYLRRGEVRGFQGGDLVEVDWDGVKRKVVAIARDHIVVDPPLEFPPEGSLSFVWNWKANTNFSLDLRPAPRSPARNRGKNGVDIGSSIEIEAYLRGDFDGDGRRDVPELPEELRGQRQLRPIQGRHSSE